MQIFEISNLTPDYPDDIIRAKGKYNITMFFNERMNSGLVFFM